jgi:hypothetical protein
MWFSIRVDWVLREKKNQFFVSSSIHIFLLFILILLLLYIIRARIPQTFIAK